MIVAFSQAPSFQDVEQKTKKTAEEVSIGRLGEGREKAGVRAKQTRT